MSDLVAIAYESEVNARAAADGMEPAEGLKPGHAALFILFTNAKPDKVLPEIGRHGGEVIRSSLTNEAEETLRTALARPPV